MDFITKWDQKGRGLFYCVSTIRGGGRRNRDNAAEIKILYADIDFKDLDITREEVIRILKRLPLPPTRIHFSGHGVHAIWVLKEATNNMDSVTMLLRRLCVVVGGDKHVCQVAALLRMPGTHNTKNDAWTEVTVIRETKRKYSLEELEAWLQTAQPVIFRKKSDGDSNPFIRAANEQGVKPPINVKQRLADMRYRGPGDASIHFTQLSVTASLLNSGEDVGDVVECVLEATMAVGQPEWNWDRERDALEKMCATWLEKHPQIAVEHAASKRTRP